MKYKYKKYVLSHKYIYENEHLFTVLNEITFQKFNQKHIREYSLIIITRVAWISVGCHTKYVIKFKTILECISKVKKLSKL